VSGSEVRMKTLESKNEVSYLGKYIRRNLMTDTVHSVVRSVQCFSTVR
jgi:hypothetical protein